MLLVCFDTSDDLISGEAELQIASKFSSLVRCSAELRHDILPSSDITSILPAAASG